MAEQRKIRVGILFGGQSVEHEISILSAGNILAALDRSRFEPIPIGIDKAGNWLVQDARRLLARANDPRWVSIENGTPIRTLAQLAMPDAGFSVEGCPVDVVFPVLHGPMGEDGTIQGCWISQEFPTWVPASSVPRSAWTRM